MQIHSPQSEENKFHNYCNFALAHIPKNEWLINIDCDHIYHAKKLYKSFYLAKHKYDIVCVARIYHLLVKRRKVFVGKCYGDDCILEDYFTNGADHRLIYNDDLAFTIWHPDKEKQLFFEGLTWKNKRRHIFTELNNYHFSLVKRSRANLLDGMLENAFTLDEVRKSDLVGTRIDPALLDEAKILQIYDNFEWDKAGYEKP